MNTLTAPSPACAAPRTFDTPAVRAASAPFRIAPGAVLTLRQGRDMRVEVIVGRLWITGAGDAQDHFVGPGGRHSMGRVAAVVIESLGPTPALLRIVPDR